MFCGNCGNQVPEGANVCPNCGTPLAGAPVQQAAPQADVNFTQAAPQPDGQCLHHEKADAETVYRKQQKKNPA